MVQDFSHHQYETMVGGEPVGAGEGSGVGRWEEAWTQKPTIFGQIKGGFCEFLCRITSVLFWSFFGFILKDFGLSAVFFYFIWLDHNITHPMAMPMEPQTVRLAVGYKPWETKLEEVFFSLGLWGICWKVLLMWNTFSLVNLEKYSV